MNNSNDQKNKPVALRVIFILNALLSILPFILYFALVSTSEDPIVEPTWIVYTGIAYLLNFIFIILGILKRNLTLVRIILVITLIVSLPTKAYLGMGVAILSLIISFLNKKVKNYFSWRPIS